MVVVVSPPQFDETSSPIFVFADEKAWRGSEEWRQCVERCGGSKVFVELACEPSSLPLKEAVESVKEASVVVIGGLSASLTYWTQVGFDDALAACHKSGGIITTVGPVCSLLAAWYLNRDLNLAKGLNLVRDAVVCVCHDVEHWEGCENIVASLHKKGLDTVKGYGVFDRGGATFYRSGDESRAEAIGKTVLECSSIPKTQTLGKVVKLRKIQVPDPSLVGALGNDPSSRWRSVLNVAAKWLVAAQGTVVVSTGAGVSAESGIPTYRDPGGLWEIYDQMEVSHIKGFARDPMKCWRFELELHQMLKHCGPNRGHIALHRLERAGVVKTVVTQNVDGLHLAAGSKDVIELHGSETRGICMRAECRKTVPYLDVFRSLGWTDDSGSTTSVAPPLPKQQRERVKGGIYAELTDSSGCSSSSSESSSSSGEDSSPRSISTSGDDAKSSAGVRKFNAVVQKLLKQTKDGALASRIAHGPRCPFCKVGLLKPDAVYFGEPLFKADIRRALKLSSVAKAFLIVGTSGQVAPACKLPVLAKVKASAKVIEISPRETDMSTHADLLLMGSAATILPALADAVEQLLTEMRLNGQSRTETKHSGCKPRHLSVSARRRRGKNHCVSGTRTSKNRRTKFKRKLLKLHRMRRARKHMHSR